MSLDIKSIIQLIENSKESLDVSYGFCRGKFNLSIKDDLYLGLQILTLIDAKTSHQWFSLAMKRHPEIQGADLILPLLEPTSQITLDEHVSKYSHTLNQPIQTYDLLVFSTSLLYTCLNQKNLPLFFKLYPLLSRSDDTLPFLSHQVKSWLRNLPEDDLLSFIHSGYNMSSIKKDSLFIDAISIYVNKYTYDFSNPLSERLHFKREISPDFALRIGQTLIQREHFLDAEAWIPQDSQEGQHLLLSSALASKRGFHQLASKHLLHYFRYKSIKLSQEVITLIERSFLNSHGPQKTLQLLDQMSSVSQNSNLLLMKAHLQSTFFSHEKALSLLKPHLDHPEVLSKFLDIKMKLPFTPIMKSTIEKDFQAALDKFPDSIHLKVSYIHYCIHTYQAKSALNYTLQNLASFSYPPTYLQKKSVELFLITRDHIDEATKYLYRLLQSKHSDLNVILWGCNQLLLAGHSKYVTDYLEHYPYPNNINSDLFPRLRTLLQDLGLKQLVSKLDQSLIQRSDQANVLKVAHQISREGEFEQAQEILAKCQDLPMDPIEVQFTKIIAKCSNGLYHDHRQELFHLISNDSGPFLLQRVCFFLKNMSDHEGLLNLCDEILKKYPTFQLALSYKVTCLISVGKTEEANALIAQMGILDHPKMVELKEWQMQHRGLIDQAKNLFHLRTNQQYQAWKHYSTEGLKRLDHNPLPQKDEILLFAIFKDEELRINSFLNHYRKLGVEKFIIIDNDSSDSTTDKLLSQKDVNLFSMKGNYVAACYGMRWVNHLANSLASHNWRIVADADEYLIYPFCETQPLRKLIDYLDEHQFEVVRGFMLDMIPEKLEHLKEYHPDKDPIEPSGYFDKSHRIIPLEHSPYETFAGGSRHRLLFKDTFYSRQPLCKTAMIKGGKGIVHTSANHYTSPAKVADITTTYLHYKFLVDWQKRGKDLANDIAHGAYAGALKQYSQFSEANPSTSLLCPDTVHYQNSEQLIQLGLLHPGQFSSNHKASL